MRGWRAGIGMAAALATGACAANGRFLGAEDQTFTTLPPTAIVLIYSPAAEGELAPEFCAERDGSSPFGFLSDRGGVPEVVRALARSGGELLVYADCPLARGHVGAAAFETARPEPCFARGAEPASGYVELKACRRFEDLQRFAQEVARNLPPERIFLAGSGVGGWGALLAARDPFRTFNAAIAIDPAITGPRVPRNEDWVAAAERHRAWLGSGAPVPALVIAGAGATPESDGLPGLAEAAPGLVFAAPVADPVAEAQAIRAYIDCKVEDPTASCAPGNGES